ncbi:MAG: hypothetical protein KC609_17215, partial [Myxococcales bacterium]|nr:hypothetical protein [Myxococcales bacterium]
SFEIDAARLSALRERAMSDLQAYLLADLDDDSLRALETRLRCPGLVAVKRRTDEEIAACERERAQLAGDPEVEHYEHHHSAVTDEREELRGPHEQMSAERRRWEDSKWFDELQADGFFEPTYDPGLFQKFLDWRAGSFWMDEVEPALGRTFENLDELREAYLKLRTSADSVKEAYDGLGARLDALSAKRQRYDQLVRQPDVLHRQMVTTLEEAIAAHLDACPSDLRLEIAEGDPNLDAAMKKLTGLQKQSQYLRELRVVRVDSVVQQLEQQLRKLDRTIAKTERKIAKYGPGYRASAEAVNKLETLQRKKWDKRVASLDKVRTRVSDFDRYDHGSLSNDFLWWMLITDGMRGNDLYEVRVFTEQHPDWTLPLAPDDPDGVDLAADALAEEMIAGSDEAGLSDAS